MRRALAASLAAFLIACGGAQEPARTPSDGPAPSARTTWGGAPWAGALVDPSRDFVIEVAPRDLGRDAAYGPIFRRALSLAAANGGPLHGTSLDLLEQADAIVVSVRAEPDANDGRVARDVVAIVAGVPASLDAARLLGESGEPIFVRSRDARRDGDVAELVAREDRAANEPSTLFVIPGRTWVLGVGPAAERVRSALARTAPATPYTPDSRGLVRITLGGDVITHLRARTGRWLGPLARGLRRFDFEVSSGKEGRVRAELVYDDAAGAHDAEPRVRELVARLVATLLPGVDVSSWLDVKGPSASSPTSVVAVARVPSTVLAALAAP